mmetsp:Transcript_144838/g.263100  ORF Transcript_144838/g.263100 Transcript_144838/m.263100 type:complete len:284 (+) Transcript_144838:83-934(+)
MPDFKVLVTQPTEPPPSTCTFIRMFSVFSSLRGNSSTSKTVPGLSASFPLSLPFSSSSKSVVRSTCFETLKVEPPSVRNVVPLFPAIVTQPSLSSLTALALIRFTLEALSVIGPRRTSTTSSFSRRRTLVNFPPSIFILMFSVMTVELTTFIVWRMRRRKSSLGSSPSGARSLKTLVRSSAERSIDSKTGTSSSLALVSSSSFASLASSSVSSFASPSPSSAGVSSSAFASASSFAFVSSKKSSLISASAYWKNSSHSSSSITPSPFVSIAVKNSSGSCFRNL